MGRKSRKWMIIPILTIIGMIGAASAWGWSQKAIIDRYYTALPDTTNFQYGPMYVSISYQNRGESDLSVLLIVNITNGYVDTVAKVGSPGYRNNSIAFGYLIPRMMSIPQSIPLTIMPSDASSNFTINYRIEKLGSTDIIQGWVNGFAQLNPTGPICVLYEYADNGNYARKSCP